MKYRIKAAWKVLRGEWVAHPRPTTGFYVDANGTTDWYTSTATNVNIVCEPKPR